MAIYLTRAIRIGRALAGWILVYVAVGALFGFAARNGEIEPGSCLPYAGPFGAIDSDCADHFVNFIWGAIIGIPRLLIVLPAVALALVKAAIHNGWVSGLSYLTDSLWFFAYSTPLEVLAWTGLSYWHSRSRWIAWGLGLLLMTEILALAWQE